MLVPKLRFKEFTDEWYEEKLKNYAKIFDGTHETPNYINSGIKFISVENIKDLYKSTKYISEEDYTKYKIKPEKNDIFMTRIGDIGNSNIYDGKEPLAYYVSLALIKTNLNTCYINQYIKSQYFQKELHNRTIHVAFPKKINTGEIGNCRIYRCSKKEQEMIGNFLSLLDKKIELQSRKIEVLKLYKIYTKNELLKNGDKICNLSEILTKWNERNKFGEITYVESISNKYGFISQNEQFEDRNVASKDLNNYYVIKKNVFGYNPSRLNVGSLALKKDDKISVVSPLYECFTTNQNSKFLLEWFNSIYFKKGTISKFEGGVRNTLNFKNLCDIEIYLPTKEKQNKYSEYFQCFDKKISLECNKLDRLVSMKKGIMQDMFI